MDKSPFILESLIENICDGYFYSEILYENEIPVDLKLINIEFSNAIIPNINPEVLIGKNVSSIIKDPCNNSDLKNYFIELLANVNRNSFHSDITLLGKPYSLTTYKTKDNCLLSLFIEPDKQSNNQDNINSINPLFTSVENNVVSGKHDNIYKELFASFLDGVYILDRTNLKILDANPSACKMYGYSLVEIRQLTVLDISAEQDATLQGIEKNITQVSYRLHKRKDGTVFPVEINVTLFNYKDNVLHIVQVRDITEQVKTDKQLHHNASFPHFNPNPIIEINSIKEITYINPVVKEILKQTGIEDAHVFLPSDIDEILKGFRPENNDSIKREVSFLNRYFEEKIIFTPGSETVRIYCREITEQKQIENELRENEQILKEAQRLAKVGNFKYEYSNEKMIWSEEVFGIFGRDKKLKPPKYNELAKFYSHESLVRHKMNVEYALITGNSYNAEYEINREDNGKKVWINVIGRPLMDENGIPYFEGVIQDITERKENEKKLKSINRALHTLSGCNQVLIHAETEAEILSNICNLIVKESGYLFAWIGYVQNDDNQSVIPISFAGYEDGYLKNAKITWADTEKGRGPTGNAIRSGEPSICHDMKTDPNFKPWRREALKRGYRSSIVLPLISNGLTFGTISIYSSEPNLFDSEEIKLLNELSEDLSYGIMAIRNKVERRRAEEKAKEAYNLYKMIFENSEEGLLLTSPDGNIYDANPAATRILGWSKGEFISIGRSGVIDLNDPRLPNFLKNRLRLGYATSELTLIHKDGRKLDGEISSRIFYNNKGESFTSMIFRDITERKRMQELIVNKEQELRTLFEILPIGVSIVDEKRNIIKTNPAFDKVLGMPKDEIPESVSIKRKYLRSNLTLMSSSEFPSYVAINDQKTVIDEEIGLLKEDGEFIWTNVSAAPLSASTAVVVTTNITEKMESERNLKDAQELAKIGSFNFNVDTGKIKWSDEMFRIFGRDKNSGEPDYEELSKCYTPESWVLHNEAVKNAVENGIPYNLEFEFIRADNNKKGWLNAIGKVSRDVNRKVYEIFGTAQDVTERKQAMHELNKLNSEILDLYNNAPCGYHSLDKDGNIIRMNDTELKWFGYERDEVVSGLNISDILTPESYKKFKFTFPIYMQKGYLNDLEMEFIRKDGSVFYGNVNSTTVYDEVGKFKNSRSTIFDITERKEVERKLELSSKNWSDTFNAIEDFIWLLDTNGTILQSNRSSEEYFCKSCGNEVGQKCFEIMHETNSFIHNCPFTSMHVSKKREVKEQYRNGKTYSVTVDPIFNDNNKLVGAVHIMSDITKLKEAENQMRDFAAHIQKAREEERTTLSRILHDSFGQSLTGLKMEISSLEKKLNKTYNVKDYPELTEKISSMKTILDDSVALTSKISMDLRPNVLDMLGLVPAIEWLAKDFTEKSEIECTLDKTMDSFGVNPKTSTEIFRILQEALTNVVRHADASKVKIILREDLNEYTIKVRDNGRGIEEKEKISPYSLGLLGMRERALIFNGAIEIKNLKTGTEVIIKIPKIIYD